MSLREAPTRTEALLAYGISALTTLLWVACVLPAGVLAAPGLTGDDAVPLHRQAILLVPALLLLIAAPVGSTLARRQRGMRAVLAATDTFVTFYVALALLAEGVARDTATVVAVLLLSVIGALSALETWRTTRPQEVTLRMPAWLAGGRLAVCLLVLVLPLHILLAPDVERASLLAPFFFVAVSAGGARLAGSMHGLYRTGALVQLLLAAHLFITLRYTIYMTDPALERVLATGVVALSLALAVVLATLLQFAVTLRARPAIAPEVAEEAVGTA